LARAPWRRGHADISDQVYSAADDSELLKLERTSLSSMTPRGPTTTKQLGSVRYGGPNSRGLMMRFRLCALWDSAQHRESVMTVMELVDHDDVILALAEETFAAYANLPTTVYHQDHETEEMRNLIADAMSRSNAEFGDQQAWIDDLKTAIKATREFECSELMASLRNHRDKYLAHSLRSTRREKLGPVSPLKYGNETAVLERSLPIIEALYCWVNGTSISLTASRESDRRNAQALWGACTFENDVP
jgi:AbiU2